MTPGLENLDGADSSWAITPALGATNKHVHRLIVALTKNPPEPKPTEVRIIGQGKKTIILPSVAPSGSDDLRNNDNYLQSITPQNDLK